LVPLLKHALSRARILDLLQSGQAPAGIASLLQAALYDQPRSGRPIEISGSQRAKVTALACSLPPAGRARWTLRLLADKPVELGHCQRLSHTAARKILEKTNSDRT